MSIVLPGNGLPSIAYAGGAGIPDVESLAATEIATVSV
jgi:hypothetical protein